MDSFKESIKSGYIVIDKKLILSIFKASSKIKHSIFQTQFLKGN